MFNIRTMINKENVIVSILALSHRNYKSKQPAHLLQMNNIEAADIFLESLPESDFVYQVIKSPLKRVLN